MHAEQLPSTVVPAKSGANSRSLIPFRVRIDRQIAHTVTEATVVTLPM